MVNNQCNWMAFFHIQDKSIELDPYTDPEVITALFNIQRAINRDLSDFNNAANSVLKLSIS